MEDVDLQQMDELNQKLHDDEDAYFAYLEAVIFWGDSEAARLVRNTALAAENKKLALDKIAWIAAKIQMDEKVVTLAVKVNYPD